MLLLPQLLPCSANGICRSWYACFPNHVQVITILLRCEVTTQTLITQVDITHYDTQGIEPIFGMVMLNDLFSLAGLRGSPLIELYQVS